MKTLKLRARNEMKIVVCGFGACAGMTNIKASFCQEFQVTLMSGR